MKPWSLGRASAQPPVPSRQLDQKVYGQIYGETSAHILAGPMSAKDPSIAPDNNVPAPTFTERVRDFAIGRRSLKSLRGTKGKNTGTNVLETTSDAAQESSHSGFLDPDTLFKDKYLLRLDARQPLRYRIQALKEACEEIEIHSGDMLLAILMVAKDFTSGTAPLDIRIAGYDLLLASAGHTGLDTGERLKFFNLIIIPLPSSHANLQVLALEKLTQEGRLLSPFETQLVHFLNGLVKEVFDAAVQARSMRKRQGSLRSNDPIGEEVSLTSLLILIEKIVRFNPDVFQQEALALLINRMLSIFTKTTVRDDISKALVIFELLISSPYLPVTSVEPCVEILCAMSGNPSMTSEKPTGCLHILLTRESRGATLETLLKFLSIKPEERKPHVVFGAFSAVDHVLAMNGADNFPIISLQPLSVALISLCRSSHGFTSDCLRVAGRLLHDDHSNYDLFGENWVIVESTLHEFANIANELSRSHRSALGFRTSVTSSSPFDRYFSTRWSKLYAKEFKIQERLRNIASAFESRWDNLDRNQKSFTVNIFLILEPYVDDDILDLVIYFLANERLIFPPDENWTRHLELLVHLILFEPSKTESTRGKALQTVMEVHAAVQTDPESLSLFDEIGLRIVRRMMAEDKVQVLSAMADFSTQYAKDASMEVFDSVIGIFCQLIGVHQVMESSTQTSISYELMPEFTTCLVRLFLHCLPLSAEKTSKIFKILVAIAANSDNPAKGRLAAIKLLSRIRCNANHAIKIVNMPDSQGLAAALYRTESSAYMQPTSQIPPNRVSFAEEFHLPRTGRTSAIGSSRSDRSRSATRSASGKERLPRPTPPLWLYGDSKGLPEDPPSEASLVVYASSSNSNALHILEISLWMDTINDVLAKGDDWEIYSYLLVHLPSQLSNASLFNCEAKHIQDLHSLVVSQLQTGKLQIPPASTGVKQGDVALCLFHSLTMLISYRERFTKKQLDETVRTFLRGMEKWDGARKCCIHALVLCSHELPYHLDKYLYNIIQKMSQIITQSHLAMDILEFLGGLVRLPDAYRSTNLILFRTIFGICNIYLKNSRKERGKRMGMPSSRASQTSLRYSNAHAEVPLNQELSNASDGQKDLPEYVCALAYHVITFWFLAIDIQERSSHVGWITKNLGYQNDRGQEMMDEQSQLTLDMMHRTAYSDLGETLPHPSFKDEDSKITKKTWLLGMSIVTVETFKDSGLTQLTKRQASGTTYAIFQQQTAPLPSHHIQPRSNVSSFSSVGGTNILPNHVLLQLNSTITPMPIPIQPIVVPDDDSTRRAIRTFDQNDTVDGHKAGVIYIASAQTSEAEILANTCGTALYDDFLAGLGTKVELRHAKFNTQGLDRETDLDGTHTLAWRDRVTEMVFHVTTMMPTNTQHDSNCVNKKRHIGNDFVNIIFNESGLPFDTDTFKSQFNYVNIIITPDTMAAMRRLSVTSGNALTEATIQEGNDGESKSEPQACFIVQTICSPSFPQISPAATPKLVTALTLPGFVRQLALNASVFSLVWSNRAGGEHISSWRNRLKAIVKLRERYANTAVSANVAYPDMGTPQDRGGARSYLEGDPWKGTLIMGGLAEENQMNLSLDFTRWT